MPAARVEGVVKFYQNGHGFITRDDGQRDVFVHEVDLKDSRLIYGTFLKEARVTFEVFENGHRGPRARNIQLAG
jgi:cold shock CspA family protein